MSCFPQLFRYGLPQKYFGDVIWPTMPGMRCSPGLTTGICDLEFPIGANAADPCSWEVPMALTWQTRGIRKMNGWPAGVWNSRGRTTSCPGMCLVFWNVQTRLYSWISSTTSQHQCSCQKLFHSQPGPGCASARSHQGSILSFLSSTNQYFLQDKLWPVDLFLLSIFRYKNSAL